MIHAGNTTFAGLPPHSSAVIEPCGAVKQGWRFPQSKFSAIWLGLNFHKSIFPGTLSSYVPTDGAYITEQCVCLHTSPGPKPIRVIGCFSLTSTGSGWGQFWSVCTSAARGVQTNPIGCSGFQSSLKNTSLITNLPQTPCKHTWPNINTPPALN